MGLQRAPLLLLGAALSSFLPESRCGSPRHSLCYSYLKVSECSQGLPQFLSMVHLDDQLIARYDNQTRRIEPLVPWMEVAEEAKIFVTSEKVFREDLETLSNLNHQPRELHTWQMILSCQLWHGESTGGFLHYGYNGMDFISFDKETLRWVAAQPQAKKVKEKWEEDPGWSQRNTFYLEETCIEQLKDYLSYRNKAQQEPPVGKVTRKVVDDSLETLTCQAYGFYPREIQATWRRDGEVCEYETLHGNVAPNSDGTHYVWLSVDIDPQERDRFRCHLEHEALQEPLVLAWEEETARTRWWIPVGLVAVIILGAGILFLIRQQWRCRNQVLRKVKSPHDHIPSEVVASPPVDGTEDDIQSQAMLQPKITCLLMAPGEAEGLLSALKVTESTLPVQEQKQWRLGRQNSWPGGLEVSSPTPAEAEATESGERVTKEPVESPEVSEGIAESAKKLSQKGKSLLDHIPSEVVAFPPVDGTEDDIQSQAMLQPKITCLHEILYELSKFQNVFNAMSALSWQKLKQQRFRRRNSWDGGLEASLQILAESGAAESGERVTKEPVESPGVSEGIAESAKKLSQKGKSLLDHIPSEVVASPPVDGTEDDIQSQAMLQPKITCLHEILYELSKLQNVFNAMSALSWQKLKQQRFRRWNSWDGGLEVSLQILAEAGAAVSG